MPAPSELDLSDRSAVVTGDWRGWTPYLAAALAEAGAAVAVAGPAGSGRAAAVSAVEGLGRPVLELEADLTSGAGVEAMMAEAADRTGGTDILVNNVGVEFGKPFVEVTEAEWDAVMAAGVRSTFLCCRSAGRRMLAQGSGRIVNIGSGLADRGLANAAAVSAGQGAIRQLTASLALEWAAAGVRVNMIAAGGLSTGRADEEGAGREIPVGYIPSRRWGHPSDLCGLMVYLASDASDFVTGQTFHVDGGLIAHA